MALTHIFDTVQNATTGVPINGVDIQLFDQVSGDVAPIYRDTLFTPFDPPNVATTEAGGFYSFYVDDGTYIIRLSLGGVVLREIKDFTPNAGTGSEGGGPTGRYPLDAPTDGQTEFELPFTALVAPMVERNGIPVPAVLTENNTIILGAPAEGGDAMIASPITPVRIPAVDVANVVGLPAVLSGKASTSVATPLANGLMSSTDKAKINTLQNSENLFFIAPGLSARSRTLLDRGKQVVYASDYNDYDYTGVGDSASAVMRAADRLGDAGGGICIESGAFARISQSVNLPPNTHLVGPHSFVGSPQDNSFYPYNRVGGALLLDSNRKINLYGSASAKGLFVLRRGMTFPAPSAAAYGGVAFEAQADDVGLEHVMIIGFAQAYQSEGHSRPRIKNVYFDCVAGFKVGQCYDNPYFFQNHSWPFGTVGQAGTGPALRSGSAYQFYDTADWGMFTNNFSWGSFRGLDVLNCAHFTAIGCGFDQYNDGTASLHPGSIGIAITGTSIDCAVVDCLTAANETAGVYWDIGDGNKGILANHRTWGGSTHGALINSGDIQVNGGIMRDLAYGVSTVSTGSATMVSGVAFKAITTRPVNLAAGTTKAQIGINDYGGFAGASVEGLTLLQVASAAAISIPPYTDAIIVTGATSVGTLGGGTARSKATLHAAAGFSLLHSTGSITAMRLKGAVDAAIPAGGCVSLEHNGTQWVETGRSF